jgi:hypothetical protein
MEELNGSCGECNAECGTEDGEEENFTKQLRNDGAA